MKALNVKRKHCKETVKKREQILRLYQSLLMIHFEISQYTSNWINIVTLVFESFFYVMVLGLIFQCPQSVDLVPS